MGDNGYGYRHVHTFLLLSCVTVAFMLRVNISVAIVAMTDSSKSNPNFPEFDWSEKEKSFILSSYFFGAVIPQIIVGNISEKIGSKLILLVVMGSAGLITILTPALAGLGVAAVCIARFFIGFGLGCVYPAANSLLSKWIPPKERSKLYPVVYSGSYLGNAIGLLLSGILASSTGGWPSVFHVTGGISIIWVIFWSIFAGSSPVQHSWIRESEFVYIKSSLEHTTFEFKNVKTPWRQLLTSSALWAVIIAHAGQSWGFTTFVTELPSYINYVLNFDIESNGFLSSLPYICSWIAVIIFTDVAKRIENAEIGTKTFQRKFWNSISFWGASIALFLLFFMQDRDTTFTMLLLIVAVVFIAASLNGFFTNHVDLSPNFSGTLMGITNTFANIASICAPLAVGIVVEDQTSDAEWKTVFLISGLFMFFTNIVYIIFGTAEVQHWNFAEEITKNENDSETQALLGKQKKSAEMNL